MSSLRPIARKRASLPLSCRKIRGTGHLFAYVGHRCFLADAERRSKMTIPSNACHKFFAFRQGQVNFVSSRLSDQERSMPSSSLDEIVGRILAVLFKQRSKTLPKPTASKGGTASPICR